jgi:hypothetical protein
VRNIIKKIPIELILISGSTITGLACLYFIFFSEEYTFDPFEKVAVKLEGAGQVYERTNKLVRKSLGQFTWEDVKKEDKVYFKDRLFTSEKSNATIVLDKGDEITMGPQTLIEIEVVNDTQNIAFYKGTAKLKVSGKSKSQLTIGNQTFIVAGESSTLEITRMSEDEENALFDVIEGEIALETAEGKTITVEEGSRIEVSKEPVKVKKSFLKTSLKNPSNGYGFEYIDQIDLELEWREYGEKSSLILEVSRDDDFDQIFKRFENVSLKQRISLQAEGEYFWRVRSPEQKEGIRFNEFSLKKLKPVFLYFPKNKTYFSMNIEEKKRQVDISWSKNDQKSYELEIENIETQEIVFKEKTDRNLKPVKLSKGLYRWRVTTLGQKIRGPSTEWREFEIDYEVNPLEGKKPRLRAPEIGYIFTPTSPDTELKFEWTQVKGNFKQRDLKYLVELFNSNQKLIGEIRTESLSYSRKNWKDVGTYSVRVTPYLGKFRGETSDLVEFEVFHPNAPEAPVAPEAYQFERLRQGRIPNSAEEKERSIVWNNFGEGFSYKVEIAEDEAFEKVLRTWTTKDNFFSWPINKEGTYYVRIAAINGWETQGPWGLPITVDIIKPSLSDEAKALLKQRRDKEVKEKEKKRFLDKKLEQFKKFLGDLELKKKLRKIFHPKQLLPQSIFLNVGGSYYNYSMDSSTLSATAGEIMTNYGVTANFNVMDTFVGQIMYLHKQSVTTSGQDFQDTSYRIVLGRSFYLTENFKIKPTIGAKLATLTFFKQTGNTITGYPVNFTAFNTTLMVAWDQTNEFIHDAGIYADFGTFSQYGVEYQLTYRPLGSQWLFDASMLYLNGTATHTDENSEKTLTKSEFQFGLQIGREFF